MKSKTIRLNEEQCACLRSIIKVALDELLIPSPNVDYDTNLKTILIRDRIIEVKRKLSD